MALTLKTKSKTREDSTAVVSAVELIDRYGDNQKEIDKVKAKMAKLALELKPFADKAKAMDAELEALYADKPDDEELTVEGTRYYLDLGKKGSERVITDLKHIRKVMKDEVFFQVAKINLGDVDKYLTKVEQEKCVRTDRTTRGKKVRERKGD